MSIRAIIGETKKNNILKNNNKWNNWTKLTC